MVVGEFVGEPPMEGYPPIFPDAIAHGSYVGDHRSRPLTVVPSEQEGEAILRCSFAPCRTSFRFDLKSGDPNNRVWSKPCEGPNFLAVFEIKPAIDSVGRVLRQMQLYRERALAFAQSKRWGTYWNASQLLMLLLTFDVRFRKAFESQNVVVCDLNAVMERPATGTAQRTLSEVGEKEAHENS